MASRLEERCGGCPAHSHCVLADLPEEAFAELSRVAETRVYVEGSFLFRQGDRADGVSIVRSGTVRLTHASASGRSAEVGVARPASLLGLTQVITSSAYRLSAVAVEECVTEHVPRQRFVPVLLKTPELAVNLLVRVSEDLQTAFDELCSLRTGAFSNRERLVRTLHDLAEIFGEPQGRGVVLRRSITVQEMSLWLGLSRQWTTKLLQEVEDEGLLERTGRRYRLTDAFLERHPIDGPGSG